ncbi:cupin domain-containing protein [Novosphingobium pentaromativorans]|uniref:ChrR-like cupin domain-containing protein n=1 Tax=Novosphingobium pentaromativorans US6-1 TaxID=1088721 RepID=G6EAZ9_9SPHN|nr:hypothetical protein [Novosphingobium pentaromativorans]EHJ61466.1 hypothetical protein NSU_1520 [Novosphingobium pentaromativorans US6-1]
MGFGRKGAAPRFVHADDVEWREVLAQDHAGRRVSVREKWLELTPRCMAFLAEWDPGMTVSLHGHYATNTIFVLSGSMTVGDRECPAGTHITLDIGVPYGPLTAGPEGVTLYEVMVGDPTPWHADPEGYDRLLQERGIAKLPNPPLDLPDWIEDQRKLYSGETG